MPISARKSGSKAVKPRAQRQQPLLRRQDLLQVTIRCLAQFGPRGATGREICRQAGVSHGLLRHYFDNPDNLLLETYQQLCDQFLARFENELAPDESNPWKALERFFDLLFSEEWASADVLGAWMAFWTLVRTNDEFAQISDSFNKRLRELLRTAARRLPHDEMTLKMNDAIAILSAVMDGLWLDFCISPKRTPRPRAVALCNLTARKLFAA
jgi:AcrR family transcriptional regulator